MVKGQILQLSTGQGSHGDVPLWFSASLLRLQYASSDLYIYLKCQNQYHIHVLL